jgi:hypothetical protein
MLPTPTARTLPRRRRSAGSVSRTPFLPIDLPDLAVLAGLVNPLAEVSAGDLRAELGNGDGAGPCWFRVADGVYHLGGFPIVLLRSIRTTY